MPSPSKENNILELFFDMPTKHWHFEEILKEAKISRPKTTLWLKKMLKEKVIRRVKIEGKMPYYIGNYEDPNYQYRKKRFAMDRFYESGLLNYLKSLDDVKGIILFGSFSRSDWHKQSDIDIFIYGDPKEVRIGEYEIKLHRDIHIFLGKDKKDLKRIGAPLLRNIIRGDLIKGDIPREVIANASV